MVGSTTHNTAHTQNKILTDIDQVPNIARDLARHEVVANIQGS